jgi:hypothetical protein
MRYSYKIKGRKYDEPGETSHEGVVDDAATPKEACLLALDAQFGTPGEGETPFDRMNKWAGGGDDMRLQHDDLEDSDDHWRYGGYEWEFFIDVEEAPAQASGQAVVGKATSVAKAFYQFAALELVDRISKLKLESEYSEEDRGIGLDNASTHEIMAAYESIVNEARNLQKNAKFGPAIPLPE